MYTTMNAGLGAGAGSNAAAMRPPPRLALNDVVVVAGDWKAACSGVLVHEPTRRSSGQNMAKVKSFLGVVPRRKKPEGAARRITWARGEWDAKEVQRKNGSVPRRLGLHEKVSLYQSRPDLDLAGIMERLEAIKRLEAMTMMRAGPQSRAMFGGGLGSGFGERVDEEEDEILTSSDDEDSDDGAAGHRSHISQQPTVTADDEEEEEEKAKDEEAKAAEQEPKYKSSCSAAAIAQDDPMEVDSDSEAATKADADERWEEDKIIEVESKNSDSTAASDNKVARGQKSKTMQYGVVKRYYPSFMSKEA